MKKSQFSEERIIAIPKQQESGVSAADVCRVREVSSATFEKVEGEVPRARVVGCQEAGG